MGKKYVKKTVSKGTVSKGNNKIKHKKISSVGIGGSVSGHNTNNDNVNNDNEQISFIDWIARKIMEFLIWLGIVEIPVNNNGREQFQKELDYDNFYKRLINDGWVPSNTSSNTSSNKSFVF